MKKLPLLSVVLGLIFSQTAAAAQINLGQAAEYNAFIQNNFQVSSSDTQGRIAVGGNFIVKPHQYSHDKTNAGYSVGDMVHAPGTPSLVVGGNIELQAGGSGGLQIHNTGIDHGSAVYAGQLINGHKIGSGTASKVSKSALPVDFDAAFQHLNALSDQLAAMTASATATPGDYATLTFRPAVPTTDKVYVFELTQEMLDSSYGINIEGVESDALVVFNVTNTTGYAMKNYSNNGFCQTGDSGCAVLKLETVKFNGVNTAGDTSKDRNAAPLAKQVLFNFNELSNVKLASNVFGTVLAPKAAIHAPSAPVWGQVIASSWVGNAQINVGPLTPRDGGTPSVPAPPALGLVVLALIALVCLRRKPMLPVIATTPPRYA